MSDTRLPLRTWVRPATTIEQRERGVAPPSGMEMWWCVDDDWVAPPVGAGRCRFMEAGHACGAAPVASLFRPTGGKQRRRAWDYCEQHLYGRRLENGRVLVMVMRAREALGA